MSQLAARVLLSPAGTTHLVTRLERDGLVRREVDPADGRKWFTVLTDGGGRSLQGRHPQRNESWSRHGSWSTPYRTGKMRLIGAEAITC
jgi:DNA-binding MarR family transcriptional regulator